MKHGGLLLFFISIITHGIFSMDLSPEKMDAYLQKAKNENDAMKQLLSDFEQQVEETASKMRIRFDQNTEEQLANIFAQTQILSSQLQDLKNKTATKNFLFLLLHTASEDTLYKKIEALQNDHHSTATQLSYVSQTNNRLFIFHILMAAGLLFCLWHTIKTHYNHLGYI